MTGGLMQLVAYGAQDVYLTGNPQITFFKVVYRRHTNFSMESIQQSFNGTVDFGRKATCTIARNGDLLGSCYLEATLGVADTSGYCNRVGFQMIREVELRIGGQLIDKHSGTWMYVWTELTNTGDHKRLLNNLVGGDDTPGAAGHVGLTNSNAPTAFALGADGDANGQGAVNAITGIGQTTAAAQYSQNDYQAHLTALAGVDARSVITGVPNGRAVASQRLHVPLQFSFCRNPGLALPLIALQYHEVKVLTTFSNVAGTGGDFDAKLWADYIYLDTDERRRFAQVSHEYLIEQVQHTNSTGPNTHDLNFNHPVKELVWTGGMTNGVLPAITGTNLKLVLNGHDRMAERPLKYFTHTQVWQHHTGPGGLNVTAAGAGKKEGSIGVYSFALKPEEHQPSGTCNFSRIDNAQLKITGAGDALDIYAVNYNVLRVMSGMGGLAYSN